MRKIVLGALAVAALGVGAAQAQEARALSATFVCEGGKALRLVFVGMGGADVAVVDWGGELVALRSVPTGSGVFYADFDEQRGLRWRGKGDEGFLAHLPADDSAKETVLVGGCRAVGAR